MTVTRDLAGLNDALVEVLREFLPAPVTPALRRTFGEALERVAGEFVEDFMVDVEPRGKLAAAVAYTDPDDPEEVKVIWIQHGKP